MLRIERVLTKKAYLIMRFWHQNIKLWIIKPTQKNLKFYKDILQIDIKNIEKNNQVKKNLPVMIYSNSNMTIP